jgi:xylulokinase
VFSLGYDIGSSFIKCAVLDVGSGKRVASGSHPETEMSIDSPRPGWAEQDPEVWWNNLKILTKKILREHNIHSQAIQSIGISYQMHGLVCVDRSGTVLRPSIIWCDSRAVDIGARAYKQLGMNYIQKHILNSPGNFTASKLRWVQENEPEKYRSIYKVLLPGDFIAMKLTGEIATTVSGLSEGIFWDFAKNSLSKELLEHYAIDEQLLPSIVPTFSLHGQLKKTVAEELGLCEGIAVSYRAGDQPNNAFSLGVFNPGEIAATAGTSGVVYGVIDSIQCDPYSRVNVFAHVNHTAENLRLGVLLCINGTGSMNSWLRKHFMLNHTYDEINRRAGQITVGSNALRIYPFGNGSERMLSNETVGGHIVGLDFNRHTLDHMLRAAQEGIAFSFRYGIDIMKDMGIYIDVIRAGKTNMFLSPIFQETLANVTGASIELYNTDGALGAARGAAFGAGYYRSLEEACKSLEMVECVRPDYQKSIQTIEVYDRWLEGLRKYLNVLL